MLIREVGSWSYSKDFAQSQRLQRGEGGKDQGSHRKVSGMPKVPHFPQLQASNSMGSRFDESHTVQPTVSGFMTAVELGHQRKRVCKITTGSKQLDTILGG